MLLVCDLDRTLIPNGNKPDENSLKDFYEFIEDIEDLILVYATGRNLVLFEEAQSEYGLLVPDYFLGAVGTEVYEKSRKFFGREKLKVDPDWARHIATNHPNWNRDQIEEDLSFLINDNFYLQEFDVQNNNKISFYIKNTEKKDGIISKLSEYIKDKNLKAEIIYSFDPHKNLGLLDFLPKKATKLGAVEFLLDKLNIEKDEVIYAGDSGNDLLPLTAGIKAILVNNARPEVKEKALKISKEKSIEDKLYISKQNYSAGVVEGIKHYLAK